jgi:hypothetical protein
MKTLVLATFVALLFPTLVLAGQVHGTLRQGKKFLANTKIVVICGKQEFTGSTNNRGAYSIFVKKRGKCTFTIPSKSNASYVISSYKDPVRYDFVLDKKGRLRKR